MKKFLPPFVLFLIGIVVYLYARPPAEISGQMEIPVPTESDDTTLAKKNIDGKQSVDKPIYGDPFPSKYLTNWNSDEGPMKLRQGPDMWVRGIYYFDNNEVRGRVTTRYIQKDNRKILSGYWVQPKSSQRCDYSRYGSYYWGRLAFDFEEDRFVGIWGYCDDKPKGNWNGSLS